MSDHRLSLAALGVGVGVLKMPLELVKDEVRELESPILLGPSPFPEYVSVPLPPYHHYHPELSPVELSSSSPPTAPPLS